MNDGFHALDIVFFAMVAVFLVLRLRSVLGRRTGNERPPPKEFGVRREAAPEKPDSPTPDNVVDLAAARKPAAAPLPEGPLGIGAAAIQAVDPAFSLDGFLSGARMAFEMILEAYAAGNKKVLRPLLADQVYGPFAQAIDTRMQAGETWERELIGVRKIEALEAGMDGAMAQVTVRIVSEQVNAVKDAEGRIVEGDPTQITQVVDEWTFSRDTRSGNPNWQLSATRSPEDDGLEA